jgi:hypothetical protein
MTIKLPTLLQLSQMAMWTGVSANAFALGVTLLLRHSDHWALAASVQSAILVACAVTAWRAMVVTANDGERFGRLVAERKTAEAFLEKISGATVGQFEITEEDGSSRRH